MMVFLFIEINSFTILEFLNIYTLIVVSTLKSFIGVQQSLTFTQIGLSDVFFTAIDLNNNAMQLWRLTVMYAFKAFLRIKLKFMRSHIKSSISINIIF